VQDIAIIKRRGYEGDLEEECASPFFGGSPMKNLKEVVFYRILEEFKPTNFPREYSKITSQFTRIGI